MHEKRENIVSTQNISDITNKQKIEQQIQTVVTQVAEATPGNYQEIQSAISSSAAKIVNERAALNESRARLNLPPSETSAAIDNLTAQHAELTKELSASSGYVESSEQSRADKISNYIIGIGVEDPQMADRLASDQRAIRAKYHLPDLDMKTIAPSEYEGALRNIAKKEGVEIRGTHEFSAFFNEYPYAAAVHLGEGRIAVDVEREGSLKSYQSGLAMFEHELVHALQDKYSPRMPIELMEYEAYIANGNMDGLKNDPEMVKVLFDMLIGGSVNHWYAEESERRGEKVTPQWDVR